MKKFTQVAPHKQEPFSRRVSIPFTISFREKLARGYTFAEMEIRKIKEWQNFLDTVSQMTFADVDKLYRRETDSSDTYGGKQVIHYGFGEKFRIHGIIENGQFIIIRMDSSHKVHR